MYTGYTVRDTQIRLAGLGFDPGAIDGLMGSKTRAAMTKAMSARGADRASEVFHPSGLIRVHWHWTAGAEGVIDLERRAYNTIVHHNGDVHDGVFRPEAQATYAVGRAASHTLNANSHAIGISIDGMAGAREVPFDKGSAPLNWKQVNSMLEVTAGWCKRFDIPVSRFTTLSHAEVQPTLGIRQRFKWDITWLPDMDKPGDPIAVGDRLRTMLTDLL